MLNNLSGYVGAGGPIIPILIGLSLLSLTLIVVKIFELWNVTKGESLRNGAISSWSDDPDRAVAALSGGKSPADRVTAKGLDALKSKRSRTSIETEMERFGNAEVTRMNRFLRVLEVIAMVSPLLGLLGTVLGMIQSFQELELAEGAANASVLAGGIWQALLTTAAGLIVAIPAAIGANLLAARVEVASHNIEYAAGQVLALADDPDR